jgi:DNA-binding NarL/FixJ family response regulator
MGQKRILVIEDERIVAMDLRATLVELGYAVGATATNRADAIRLAEEQKPDLVLMDVRIRGDEDGIETAIELRKRFSIPIVFVTGHSDRTTLARVSEVDHEGFLIKPVSDEQLRTTIELAMRRSREFLAEENTNVKDQPERSLIVGRSVDSALAQNWTDPLVCASPLDMIDIIETHGRQISTIVLVGSSNGSVTTAQLAQFVDATYPWVRVVTLDNAN